MMANNEENQFDDNDGEEEEVYDSPFFKPSYVIVGIDTDSSMFMKKDNISLSPFQMCLNACLEIAESLLLVKYKISWSPFSVVLSQSDNSTTLTEFSNSIIDTIKFLRDEIKLSNEELQKKYKRDDQIDLGAFLLHSKKQFKNINTVFYERIIIYISNTDNPSDDANKRFTAFNEAKTFELDNIKFHLLTMKENFNYNFFYNEFFSIMNKTQLIEKHVEEIENIVEELLYYIKRRLIARKVKFYPFINNETQFIQLIQRNFVKKSKFLNERVSEDGKIVKRMPMEYESAEDVHLRFGRLKSLKLTKAEVSEIYKNNFQIGYTLIYVSNRLSEIGYFINNPVLVEVDKNEDPMSFYSFWQFCVDNNKVLICIKKYKDNNVIEFVELIPKYVNKIKYFMSKLIPYEDEVIHPLQMAEENDRSQNEPSENEKRSVDNVINVLTFVYQPKMLLNPELNAKKRFLKSKLLEEEEVRFVDTTADDSGIFNSNEDIFGEVFEVFNVNH